MRNSTLGGFSFPLLFTAGVFLTTIPLSAADSPAYTSMKHVRVLLNKLGWKTAACRSTGLMEVGVDAKGKQLWGRSWRCLASRRLEVAVVDMITSKHVISGDNRPATGAHERRRNSLLHVRVYDQGLAEKIRRAITSRGLTRKSVETVMDRLGWKTVSSCRSCDPEIAETYLCCAYKLGGLDCSVGLAVYSDRETAMGNAGPLHSSLRGNTVLTLSLENKPAARKLLKRITAGK